MDEAVQRGLRLLAAGDLGGARRQFEDLLARHPQPAAIHQALGVVARRGGDLDGARAHLLAAVELTPADPNLHNSLANVLGDQGRSRAALRHYRIAIGLAPRAIDPRVNLGLMLRTLGRFRPARAALESAAALAPQSAAAWRALGLTLLDLEDLPLALDALDRSLALNPADVIALAARARARADAGGDALADYAEARRLAPADAQLSLDEAAALHRRGRGAEAIARLAERVRGEPQWRAGQLALAKLRWAWEGPEAFLQGYGWPPAPELARDVLQSLTRAGRYTQALEAIDSLAGAEDFALIEAVAASESGDPGRADSAFARAHERGESTGVAFVRHLLRGRDAAKAAHLAEALAGQGDEAAWPYLATAWRLNGDPRADWLEDAAFVATADLASAVDVDGLAARLRELHTGGRAPFDQSVRNGSQTDGDLFLDQHPAVKALRGVLLAAVQDYVARLPPRDAAHPLLRERRGGVRFAGSWSVRLGASGFHTHHAHPGGWISSAFYVVTPPPASLEGRDGQLLLGQPPLELGLDLPPIAMIAPQPGRLVLFPSYLWHGTAPFGEGERLSVAFDVVPQQRSRRLA